MYFKSKVQNVIVRGNESGDLDSLVSAYSLASVFNSVARSSEADVAPYHQLKFHPCVAMDRAKYNCLYETRYLLENVLNCEEIYKQILTDDDEIPKQVIFNIGAGGQIILVDHSRFTIQNSGIGDVNSIINRCDEDTILVVDHHDARHALPSGSCVEVRDGERIGSAIEKWVTSLFKGEFRRLSINVPHVGSTCSLVAIICQNLAKQYNLTISKSIQLCLALTILKDTQDFNKATKGDRWGDVDSRAFAGLTIETPTSFPKTKQVLRSLANQLPPKIVIVNDSKIYIENTRSRSTTFIWSSLDSLDVCVDNETMDLLRSWDVNLCAFLYRCNDPTLKKKTKKRYFEILVVGSDPYYRDVREAIFAKLATMNVLLRKYVREDTKHSTEMKHLYDGPLYEIDPVYSRKKLVPIVKRLLAGTT